MIRWLPAVVCGGWGLYLGYLIVASAAGNEPGYSPLRSGLVTVGAVATLLLGFGVVLHRLNGIQAKVRDVSQAIELARQLERLRCQHNGEATVLALRDHRPVS